MGIRCALMDRLISAMGLHALIAMRPLVHKIIFFCRCASRVVSFSHP